MRQSRRWPPHSWVLATPFLSGPNPARSHRLLSNHPQYPLPDGNKRTAYLCMLIQLEGAGLTFEHPDGDQDKTADVIEALAASTLSEEDFVEWVKARTTT